MSRAIWNHPEALQQLLAELPNPNQDDVDSTSRLIFVNTDFGTLTLNGAEVNKVLSAVQTVNQLFEALDQATDCTVELSNFEAQPEISERLEELFDYFESI